MEVLQQVEKLAATLKTNLRMNVYFQINSLYWLIEAFLDNFTIIKRNFLTPDFLVGLMALACY